MKVLEFFGNATGELYAGTMPETPVTANVHPIVSPEVEANGEDPQPMSRFEWERIIRRAPLQPMTKLVAVMMSQFANKNGTRIFPGNARIAAVCGVDEKTVRRHLVILREKGYLHRLQEENWRTRVQRGIADQYWLTVPANFLDLEGVLTVDEAPP